MTKLIRLFSLMLAMLLMCSCASSLNMKVPASPKVVSHMTGATVALVIYVPLSSSGRYIDRTHVYCTGVFVDETHILSASHCMTGLASMQAKVKHILTKDPASEDDDDDDSLPTADPIGLTVHYTMQNAVDAPGKEPTAIYLAKSVGVDLKHDLSLIETVGSAVPAHEVVEVAKELPPVSSTIWVVGHPLGFSFSVAKGIVSAYHNDLHNMGAQYDGPFIVVSAPTVTYGNSGGPAFSDDGHLIGIASMLAGDVPSTSLFVRADTIRKFLADQKKK
jgi:hypothetical protein